MARNPIRRGSLVQYTPVVCVFRSSVGVPPAGRSDQRPSCRVTLYCTDGLKRFLFVFPLISRSFSLGSDRQYCNIGTCVLWFSHMFVRGSTVKIYADHCPSCVEDTKPKELLLTLVFTLQLLGISTIVPLCTQSTGFLGLSMAEEGYQQRRACLFQAKNGQREADVVQ